MSREIKNRILELSEARKGYAKKKSKMKKERPEYLEGGDVMYENKPHFLEVKRIFRIAKRVPNQTKPKKLGYFFQQSRDLKNGSTHEREEILKKVFGKSMEMSPEKLRKKLNQYINSEDYPLGDEITIKQEEMKQQTYQTMQRIVQSEKYNRTISASIYGKIFRDELEKYVKKHPDFNELYRSIHGFVNRGHYSGAAAFVRYSKFANDWIHFDTFQTDFFNELRRYLHESNPTTEGEKYVDDFVNTLEKRETDFFKAAVSYIVRVYPDVKIFTANTPETAKRAERINARSGKLIQLYHVLPKELGFKLISLDKLKQIFATRPGKGEKEKNKLLDRGYNVKAVRIKNEHITTVLKDVLKRLDEAKPDLSKADIDNISYDVIRHHYSNNEDLVNNLRSGFHQIVSDLYEAYKNKEKKGEEVAGKTLKSLATDKEVFNKAKEGSKITKGEESEIWWANRGTIFEETESEKDAILRIINS